MNVNVELSLVEFSSPAPWAWNEDHSQLCTMSEEVDEYEADVIVAPDDVPMMVDDKDATFIAHARNGYPLALEVVKAVQGLGRMACVTIPDDLAFPNMAAWEAAQCRECAVCVLNAKLRDWANG